MKMWDEMRRLYAATVECDMSKVSISVGGTQAEWCAIVQKSKEDSSDAFAFTHDNATGAVTGLSCFLVMQALMKNVPVALIRDFCVELSKHINKLEEP